MKVNSNPRNSGITRIQSLAELTPEQIQALQMHVRLLTESRRKEHEDVLNRLRQAYVPEAVKDAWNEREKRTKKFESESESPNTVVYTDIPESVRKTWIRKTWDKRASY